MSLFQIDFGGEKEHKVIGIDLGTTNSLAAFMDLTGPTVIPDPNGEVIVPSVVSISEKGEPIVGRAAVERLITHPERTIYSVKRLMGRGVGDIQEELKLFPFHIAPDSDSVIHLELGGKKFTPPAVSALVLRQLNKCGSVLRRAHRTRRHHRPRLLQRRATPGDQGRRAHRRHASDAAGE